MAFAVFLILFVLIGSVSAAEDNVTSQGQDDADEISQEEISAGNDDIGLKEILNRENTTLKTAVSGDTFADIQTAIDSAGSGDTIELNGLYKGSGTAITVDKNNLTLIGNDAVLDAQGQSRILNITGAGIILKNIRFINGNVSDDGGAVYWYGDNGEVINCDFVNNTATQRAGAIYWYGVNATVNDCNFTSNTATKYCAGAIQWDSNSDNGTVNNCIFTNNIGTQRGGAVYWQGKNGRIDNCEFVNNTSINGGALNWGTDVINGTVNNSSFINNTGNDGGAVYWEGRNGRMNGCNFTNNIADHGGALNWQKTFGSIDNCIFINNKATEDGGAIFWEGSNGTENNCNFINNTAESDGGAVYWYAYNGKLNNSRFANNTAETNGGAVCWQGTNGTISDSIFTGNKAGNYSNIYGSDDLVLSNSTLETSLTINQIPDCYEGDSATVYFTFDDGTNLGGYNLTLYNNNQTIKTFKYEGICNYDYTWDSLAVGNYSITVGEINANGNSYNATYEPMNFKVEKIFIKDNKDMSVFYRQGAIFKVRIVDEKGNPVSGKSVAFKVNGVTYSALSSADGYASCNIDWKPGKSTISTACGGLAVSNSIRVKSVVHAAKNVKVKKSKKITKFNIELYGLKSKIVKKPSFVFNGKTKVPIKIGKDLAGKKVSVKFKGKYFDTKVDSKGKGVLKISKKLARQLKLKKSKKYKATVIYEDRLIYKNKQVNVKIDGKKYHIKTNKKGVAVFKITKKMVKKLKVGKKYSYYIEFGENTAKGNLIIKK